MNRQRYKKTTVNDAKQYNGFQKQFYGMSGILYQGLLCKKQCYLEHQ
jgi:hypothetical protein